MTLSITMACWQRHDRRDARLRDNRRLGSGSPDPREICPGLRGRGEVGPATMFTSEAAPKGRRMLFASWQLASQNLGSLASGLIGFLLALALLLIELHWLGLARALCDRVLIAGWRLHPKPARRNARPVAISQDGEHGAHPVRGRPERGAPLVGRVIAGTITQYFLLTMTPYDVDPAHARFYCHAGAR